MPPHSGDVVGGPPQARSSSDGDHLLTTGPTPLFELSDDTKIEAKQAHVYRPDVDGLRTLAVVPVVVFHAYPDLLPGGFIGVDVFFVISGFLISGILFKEFERGKFTYAGFYQRRIRRIFPTLILVLGVTFWLGYLYLMAPKLKAMAATMLAGTLFSANLQVLTLEHSYFDLDVKTNPLLHLWSLGVEEQFYIFWPFLASIITKMSYKKAVALQLVVLATSFLINVSFLGFHGNDKMSFYMPLSRFWQMAMGGLLVYVSKESLREVKYKCGEGGTEIECEALPSGWRIDVVENVVSATGLLLILLGFGCVNEARSFPGFWALLPTIGATLLIAAGPNAVFNYYVLSNRAVVYIGKISYCLYLWHWPLLVFAIERFPDVEVRPFYLQPYAMVVASIFLSVLTYEDVEGRLRRHKSKLVTPILVLCMVTLAVLAGSAFKNPAGFSATEIEIAKAQEAMSVAPMEAAWSNTTTTTTTVTTSAPVAPETTSPATTVAVAPATTVAVAPATTVAVAPATTALPETKVAVTTQAPSEAQTAAATTQAPATQAPAATRRIVIPSVMQARIGSNDGNWNAGAGGQCGAGSEYVATAKTPVPFPYQDPTNPEYP
ncbi:acyltransferase, partial [Achlya hypogyna]